MVQPRNYMLDVRTPFEASMQGVQAALQMGSAMRDQELVAQRGRVFDAQEAAAVAEAEKARAAVTQQEARDRKLAALAQNPTARGITQMLIEEPQLKDGLSKALEAVSAEEKAARIKQVVPVYAAIQAGRTDIAQELLAEQVAAYRNSGREDDAKQTEWFSKLLTASPKSAQIMGGAFLSAAMGDEFTENFTKLESERRAQEKAPAELSEAQAKAQKAAVEAKFEESKQVQEAAKRGWDITKLQEDIQIAKENQKIQLAELTLKRESNVLKRQELGLKIDDMKIARDEKVRAKIAEVETARATIDNTLNTADQVLKFRGTWSAKASQGPLASKMPTVLPESAEFQETLATLRSQVFTAQIPMLKGTGGLSDAEGKKLETSVVSLSPKLPPETLFRNVEELQRILLKARRNIAKKSGLPDTIPDTPAAAGRGGASGAWDAKGGGKGKPDGKAAPSIDDMLRELGVAQ